jgi:hypothetical protein
MVVRLRFAVAFVGLLSGCAPTSRAPEMRQSTIPDGVDHLVYAAADLEVGRDKIEQLLGVRPVLGGRHPQYGTHNALLSLGPATYLEIIAPDPELDVPERGVLFGADGVREPRLVTWALRSESIDDSAASASSAEVGLGSIESGSRAKPDGTVISWKLSDPYAMPLDGAVPFLISWGATPHPAGAAPRAGELVGLRIEHPDPEKVREALLPLGVEIDVRGGEQFRLIARVKTARGEVQIR